MPMPNSPATMPKMPNRVSRRTIATAPSVIATQAMAIDGTTRART